MSGRLVINPYAEQNNRIPGHTFIAEHLTTVALPGIPSSEGKWYAPLDIIMAVPKRPYKDDADGWTKVARKRRRYNRNSGWVGSDVVASN